MAGSSFRVDCYFSPDSRLFRAYSSLSAALTVNKIAGYSFKMIAFDFSSFAQHRDDRGSAKCERPGAASINRST